MIYYTQLQNTLIHTIDINIGMDLSTQVCAWVIRSSGQEVLGIRTGPAETCELTTSCV